MNTTEVIYCDGELYRKVNFIYMLLLIQLILTAVCVFLPIRQTTIADVYNKTKSIEAKIDRLTGSVTRLKDEV